MSFFTQDLANTFTTLMGGNYYLYTYTTLVQQNKHNYLIRGLKGCCGANIGEEYLNRQHRELRKQTGQFDLVVILSNPLEKLTTTKVASSMLGFMIVQLGECSMYPDTYCVNLVCSQGKGAVLLAFYLYCVNNNDMVNSKLGMLELASAYYNYGGLCLYSKYGFVHSPELFGSQCFPDYNNLPMIVDLRTQYGDQHACNTRLKEILVLNRNGFDKPAVCSASRGVKQELMGVALNIQMFLQNNKPDYIIPYVMSNDVVLQYDALYDMTVKSNISMDEYIQSIESMPEDVAKMHHSATIILPEPPVVSELTEDEPMKKRLRTRRGGRRGKKTKRSGRKQFR